jgi:hypothetical protein
MINGVYESFKGSKHVDEKGNVTYHGMVFYNLAPQFFEKYRYKNWVKPCWGCIKCMASVWGGITFWPVVVYLFGFHWVEIPIYVGDVFCLVYLNYFFYKKI